jgi:MFS family permease
MPAGSFVGALAVTQLADRIGRKPTIILAGLIWVIGSILQCASVVRDFIASYSSRSQLSWLEPWYACRWSYCFRHLRRLV